MLSLLLIVLFPPHTKVGEGLVFAWGRWFLTNHRPLQSLIFFKALKKTLEINQTNLLISHMRQQGPERVRGSPKVTQQVSKMEGGDPRQALSSTATVWQSSGGSGGFYSSCN